MCLKYFGSFDEDNDQLERERPFNEYRTGSLFRFIFICNEDKGLKNIIFKNVRVYPDYPIEVNGDPPKIYLFKNNASLIENNNYQISYIGNNKYQTTKYFMFPNDENKQSAIADKFKNDLLFSDTPIFFNIQYEAINIYGVKVEGALKFFTLATQQKDRLFFDKPTNVSNWIKTPELIENQDKK